MTYKTIIEPFRIKVTEPIKLSSEEDRRQFLKRASYNPFKLRSDEVIIDLLTDSGTSAMSQNQWAGIMQGDESYAGASSWLKLEREIRDLTGFEYVLPTHQGRAGERILYGHIGGPGKVFVSNTHFDTTRANIEFTGAEAIDIPAPESWNMEVEAPFKGNMDTNRLRAIIAERSPENIGAVILTITNNSGGGQPVSLENASEVADICKETGVMFVLDACRVAENSYFIKSREEGMQNYSYREIAQKTFRLADAAIMSAKKDGLVNMGGFLALKDKSIALDCQNLLIISEGFTTYGGLSGRDMEAMTVGLREVFEDGYLNYRIKSTQFLGDRLQKLGVPVMRPSGGHAIYVDAKKFYPHIPVERFPGHSLACELYLKGGIRSVEIGSVMFGKYDEEGNLVPAPNELVRLAIPRRVYTQSHIEYVAEVFERLVKERANARGYKIVWEPPFLRHFTAKFEPVNG